MAAFGPGCVFGETSLFTGGLRTADAVCTQPTRLFVLRREPLADLQTQSPAVYGKIVANLNFHLTTRLRSTTELVMS